MYCDGVVFEIQLWCSMVHFYDTPIWYFDIILLITLHQKNDEKYSIRGSASQWSSFISKNWFNPFVPNALFLYPLKTSENHKVFWCFQGVEKGCIGNKWANTPREKSQYWNFFLVFIFPYSSWIRTTWLYCTVLSAIIESWMESCSYYSSMVQYGKYTGLLYF